MSQSDEIDKFIEKYGHVKDFDSTVIAKKYADSYVRTISNFIKNGIGYTSFNVEGLQRTADTLNLDRGSHGVGHSVTHWSKSNTIKRETLFEVVLHSTNASYRREGVIESSYKYNINFTMTDLSTLQSVTFNNLTIKEFRDSVKEVLTVTSRFIFNI